MDEWERDSMITHISATALDDLRISPDDLASALATEQTGPGRGSPP
jgi:hypothetical protein